VNQTKPSLPGWPFRYTVPEEGGLALNGQPALAAPIAKSLREELIERGLKPSGPIPKKIKTKPAGSAGR